MKIILLGYGKMGREIEKIAEKRGHQVILRVDRDNAASVGPTELAKGDVAIEFSTPGTAAGNIRSCLDAGVPVVAGTTGWYHEFGAIKELCEKKNGALFYATNFSIGVNLFFKVNAFLAELMNQYDDYDVSMEEIHHVHKLDRPSGTAITLAEQILLNLHRKKSWALTPGGSDVLQIHDRREGEVPGTHTIRYTSSIDDIEITHRAHNRQGFATGAVLAAEFIAGKHGIYTMSDLV